MPETIDLHMSVTNIPLFGADTLELDLSITKVNVSPRPPFNKEIGLLAHEFHRVDMVAKIIINVIFLKFHTLITVILTFLRL
jgi:hypothetical protein